MVWVDDARPRPGVRDLREPQYGAAGNWTPQEVWIRDFVALTSDAYIGLWEHMKTHDLAAKISGDMDPDDPFRYIWKIRSWSPAGSLRRNAARRRYREGVRAAAVRR